MYNSSTVIVVLSKCVSKYQQIQMPIVIIATDLQQQQQQQQHTKSTLSNN